GHAHRGAGVTGLGFLYGIHGQGPNGIGKFASGGHFSSWRGKLACKQGQQRPLFSPILAWRGNSGAAGPHKPATGCYAVEKTGKAGNPPRRSVGSRTEFWQIA